MAKELEERMGIVERALDVLRADHDNCRKHQEERHKGVVKQQDETGKRFGKVDRGQQWILYLVITALAALAANLIVTVVK